MPYLDQIVPVDSEHSALAQCLRGGTPRRGAPARRSPRAAARSAGASAHELADVTPQQALAHPTWDMGPVVTVNSATLVNKGLEIIEAHLLFGIPYERIDVVVHPQSLVHSMVEFFDGSTIAQVSPPDMRLPIALALGWPDRVPDAAPGMDWTAAQSPDLRAARHRGVPGRRARQGGAAGAGAAAQPSSTPPTRRPSPPSSPADLPFLAIVEVIERTLSRVATSGTPHACRCVGE